MTELYKYVCPSCGANIDPTGDDKVITCSFCGGVYDRTAMLDEQQRKAADALALEFGKYRRDLETYNTLKSAEMQLADEVTQLSNEPAELPVWAAFIVPLQLASAVFLLVMLSIGFKANSKPMMFASGLIFAVMMIALMRADANKKRLKREAECTRAQLKNKLGELNAARAEVEKFEKEFDISLVPENLRSYETVEYLMYLFKTYQASRTGDAFRLYDLHCHHKKMEALQSEQVELQKKQLEIMDQLADYDFDDTYDDDDFTLHETLKAFRAGSDKQV